MVESAIDSGFLRPKPGDATRFQIRVKAQVGYPADPKDNKKVAAPTAGTKYRVRGHGPRQFDRVGDQASDRGHRPRQFKPADLSRSRSTTARTTRATTIYRRRSRSWRNRSCRSASRTRSPTPWVPSSSCASEMLLEAMRQVIARAGKAGGLLENVDFTNTGLLGHSRGGEAMVRAYDAQKTEGRARIDDSRRPARWRPWTHAVRLSRRNWRCLQRRTATTWSFTEPWMVTCPDSGPRAWSTRADRLPTVRPLQPGTRRW